MRVFCLLTMVPAIAVLWTGPSSARAELPPDQQVAYYIRESPNDSQSAVVFEVILGLSAQDSEQDSVGWRIDHVEFRQIKGETVTVWYKDAPEIGSPDGLWWVQHADPSDPKLNDFAEPPSLAGTASAQDPQELNLSYNLTGVYSSGNPENMALLTYTFTRVSEPEPTETGEDEPVEIIDPRPVGHS